MLETAGLGERITTLLNESADWREHAFCLSGAVALTDTETGLLLDVHDGDATCHAVDAGAAAIARVRIAGSDSGWQRLGDPTAVNATLNRLFREGDLDVAGDMDFAMHHWASLFWLVDAVRTALIENAA